MNWFSGPSAGLFSAEAHNGFGPPPASGFAMRSPFEATTSIRTPLSGIVSPAFRIVRFDAHALR